MPAAKRPSSEADKNAPRPKRRLKPPSPQESGTRPSATPKAAPTPKEPPHPPGNWEGKPPPKPLVRQVPKVRQVPQVRQVQQVPQPKPSSKRPARPSAYTPEPPSEPPPEPEPAEPAELAKSKPVAWISVPDDSQLIQQGYVNTAPVVEHLAEYQELLSDSHDILYTLADSMIEDITFQHDHDWTLFPEVGQAVKELGYAEWALCLAICPSQSVWAVGMAGQQKKRQQAARLAMSVALAAMTSTTDKKLRDTFQRSPPFISFCQTAEINVEDSVPSHPALAPSQRHANRKWNKKNQAQSEQSAQSEQWNEGEEGNENEKESDWKSDWNSDWKSDWNSGWKSDWKWNKRKDGQDTSAYEAEDDEPSKADLAYGEEAEAPENGEAEVEEEQYDDTAAAIDDLISKAQDQAQKVSEQEEMQEEPAEWKDPWRDENEDFQEEEEDKAQGEEEQPGEEQPEEDGEGEDGEDGEEGKYGFAEAVPAVPEEEFEDVPEEELEPEEEKDAMEDVNQAEAENEAPSKRRSEEEPEDPELKREVPHWVYVDELPEKLQGFNNESLVLASDGAKQDMYGQADKALQIMLGELASEVKCYDDPKPCKKFPEIGAELKFLAADQEESFTVAISPTRCLWGVGVSSRGFVRRQAAKIALAAQVALQMLEIGEEIPDLSETTAVEEFLEDAQAAKDELLPFNGKK